MNSIWKLTWRTPSLASVIHGLNSIYSCQKLSCNVLKCSSSIWAQLVSRPHDILHGLAWNNRLQINKDSCMRFLFSRLSVFFLVGSFRWVNQTSKYFQRAGISLKQWIVKHKALNSYLKNSERKLWLRSLIYDNKM